MAKCKRLRADSTAPCLGDMRNLITIYPASIVPDGFMFDKNLGTGNQIKALIKTVSTNSAGVEALDGINLKGVATHLVTIRYLADVTIDDTVEFNDKYFRILEVINHDEMNRYLTLKVSESGDTLNDSARL